MLRLKIARKQIRSFMNDVKAVRADHSDVSALAKLREALALIDEAEFLVAKRHPGNVFDDMVLPDNTQVMLR